MLTGEENDLEEKIGELACVREIRSEHWLCVLSSKYFSYNGKELDNFTNAAYLLSDSEMAINYFDENNNIIESVEKGCFYANAPFLQDLTIKKGDEVELTVGNSHLTLKFMGRYVDKGSAPQKTDEIVVTVSVLDDLGAENGDRVTAVINGKGAGYS